MQEELTENSYKSRRSIRTTLGKNSKPPRPRNLRSGPITPRIRERCKRIVLASLSENNNRTLAAQLAGIDRHTLLRWIREGFITEQELADCYAAFQDTLRNTLHEVGVKGEAVPVLDTHGRPVLDDSGNPVVKIKRNTYVLMRLGESHLPELARTAPSSSTNVNVTVNTALFVRDSDGIMCPLDRALVIDSARVRPHRLPILREIIYEIYEDEGRMSHEEVEAEKAAQAERKRLEYEEGRAAKLAAGFIEGGYVMQQFDQEYGYVNGDVAASSLNGDG